MTWEEHLAELDRIRDYCEQNEKIMPGITYGFVMNRIAELEKDRWCKGENPYQFLWGMLSFFTDIEPNPEEYNSSGYPVAIREAGKKLRAYEPTSWQLDRLLGYASWIQIHGWQAVDPRVAAELQNEYRNAGVDPEAIDFQRSTSQSPVG